MLGVNQHRAGKAEGPDALGDLAICFFEWVRALRAQGFSRPGAICSMAWAEEGCFNLIANVSRIRLKRAAALERNANSGACQRCRMYGTGRSENAMGAPPMIKLAARLNQLRCERGSRCRTVATAVGVSKAHIWELEKGRADNPSMGLVTRLAEHFGVSVAYMIGEDPG